LSDDLSHIEQFKKSRTNDIVVFHELLEEPIVNILNMPIPLVQLLVDAKVQLEKEKRRNTKQEGQRIYL